MWNVPPINPMPGPWPVLAVLPCWIALGVAALVVLGTVLVLTGVDRARGARSSRAPLHFPVSSRARRLGGSAAA